MPETDLVSGTLSEFYVHKIVSMILTKLVNTMLP